MATSLKQAAQRALNHIRKHPETYDFYELNIPKSNKDCGCVVGWIAYYTGKGLKGKSIFNFSEISGVPNHKIYEALDKINTNYRHNNVPATLKALEEVINSGFFKNRKKRITKYLGD